MTKVGKFVVFMLLSIFGLAMVVPFVWMMVTAVRSQLEFNKGNVGFLPLEKHTMFVDNEEDTIISIVMVDGDSTYVHFYDEEGHRQSA